MANKIGKLLTLEGIEGTGKTTHMGTIQSILAAHQLDCLFTREPGATAVGKIIRQYLLSTQAETSDITELCLLYADRAEHMQQIIIPALKNNQWVISDRFFDSSYAYQGYGRGIDLEIIHSLTQAVCGNIKPDLSLLFDISPEKALARIGKREQRDRFERQNIDFFKRVREGYHQLMQKDVKRWVLIDTDAPIEHVKQKIATIINDFIHNEG